MRFLENGWGHGWTPIKSSENDEFCRNSKHLELNWGGVKVRRRFTISERELRAVAWKNLNEKIDELSQRLTDIKALRGDKAAERARLSRNKRIAPLVRLIDQDLAELAVLGSLPDVSNEFCACLRKNLEAIERLVETRKRAAGDEAKLIRVHSELNVDDALLARSGDIVRLFGETGAYASNRGDMPRIQAEADEYKHALIQQAKRLGLSDMPAIEQVQPSDAAQVLIQNLISEGRNLSETVKLNIANLAAEQNSLTELERQRTKFGALVNPQPLHNRLMAFSPVLKNIERCAEMLQTIRAEERNLREAAGRLNPPIADLSSLVMAPLVSLETITRFRKDIDELTRDVRRERDRLSAAEDAVIAAESRLAEITSIRPVASAEAVAAKREERDADWRTIRGTLFGPSDATAELKLAELVASFERRSSEADQLADSATTDATRIATYAVENSRLALERSKREQATSRLAELECREHGMLNDWSGAWASVDIIPGPPADMVSWRTAIDGLLDQRKKLERLRDEFDAIDAGLRNIMPGLQSLAADIGVTGAQGSGAELLKIEIDERLRLMVESWEAARELETRIDDAQGRIKKSAAADVEARRNLEEWSARWRLALPQIRIPVNASVEEAEAALRVWKEVPATVRERDNRSRRVTGMQRNIDTFEKQAESLLGDVTPDLLALPADSAVKMLNERLSEARGTEVRKAECHRRLTEATRGREEVDTALVEAQSELTALTAILSPDTDRIDLLRRFAEQDRLVNSLRERRIQLVAQGDGHDEGTLRAELADFDIDKAVTQLEILRAEDEALEHEAQQIFAMHDQAVRERASAEQGVGAEVAAQQRASAEAELIEASREWALLKLGALLIGTAIDRRRAKHRDPLMARAGALFALLTSGSFGDIGQEYDDQEIPHLVGRRPTGATVPILGMSTGARDQLYLALRLAYLEGYASHAEPAPFIGDDLFATFDEKRTASGLASLAAIGDQVQPLIFTHHSHVAEIASKIGADVLDL